MNQGLTYSYFWIGIMILFGISACGTSTPQEGAEQEVRSVSTHSREAAPPLPYNLLVPDRKLKLPGKLEEISALSWISTYRLAAVQDEKGKVYIINLETGEIDEDYKFSNDGDYEGLEIVGETAYVVESKGILYKVDNFRSEEPTVKTYKLPLTARNDLEGLAYQVKDQSLLLACKLSPALNGQTFKGKRAVYRFDLQTGTLAEKPHMLIDLKKVKAETVQDGWKLPESLDEVFQPSGIAIHPLTGDTYIISSVGRRLIVYNSRQKLTHVLPLPRNIFKQPEGICFGPKGEMYISNEGRDGKGNILFFKPSA